MTSLLVPLAEGFEEIEATCIIDVLRRAKIEVVVASISDKLSIKGAHDIILNGDVMLSELNSSAIDGAILPGGLPGSTNLLASKELKSILLEMAQQNKLLAAICAAPQVLAAHGLLEGISATCYPGVEAKMQGARLLNQGVVCDQMRITGWGVGSALDFALAIVAHFKGSDLATTLRKAMVMF